jgi:hypothetical protein
VFGVNTESTPLVIAALGAVALAALVGTTSAAGARVMVPPDFATDIPIPAGSQIGTGDLEANCSVQMGGVTLSSMAVHVLASGALPTIVRPGQSFWITSVRGRVKLPAAASDQLYASACAS